MWFDSPDSRREFSDFAPLNRYCSLLTSWSGMGNSTWPCSPPQHSQFQLLGSVIHTTLLLVQSSMLCRTLLIATGSITVYLMGIRNGWIQTLRWQGEDFLSLPYLLSLPLCDTLILLSAFLSAGLIFSLVFMELLAYAFTYSNPTSFLIVPPEGQGWLWLGWLVTSAHPCINHWGQTSRNTLISWPESHAHHWCDR